MKIVILWDNSGDFTYTDTLSQVLLDKLGAFVQIYKSHFVKGVVYHVYRNGTVRFL